MLCSLNIFMYKSCGIAASYGDQRKYGRYFSGLFIEPTVSLHNKALQTVGSVVNTNSSL